MFLRAIVELCLSVLKKRKYLSLWSAKIVCSCSILFKLHIHNTVKYEYMKTCCKYFSCTLHKKVSVCTVFFSWGKQMSGTRYLTVAINVLSLSESVVYSSYTVFHFLFIPSLTPVYLWIQILNMLFGSVTRCYYQVSVLLPDERTFR